MAPSTCSPKCDEFTVTEGHAGVHPGNPSGGRRRPAARLRSEVYEFGPHARHFDRRLFKFKPKDQVGVLLRKPLFSQFADRALAILLPDGDPVEDFVKACFSVAAAKSTE